MEEVREAFWAELEVNTGQTREDHIEKSRVFQIAPARVEYRTNGFASRRAGAREGVLTTHPLIFQGSRLTVNAAAAEGRVAVEVRDEAGRPVAGYGRDECLLTAFDSTRQEVALERKFGSGFPPGTGGPAPLLPDECRSLRLPDSIGSSCPRPVLTPSSPCAGSGNRMETCWCWTISISRCPPPRSWP